METYTARLASFKLHPSKRKINEPYSASIAWPHSSTRFSVTPSTLAQAGFYHDPTESANDNVTCFICNKGLEGWEDGDDALDEHLKRVIDKNTHDKCPWATIMGVKRDFDLFGKDEYENGKHDPSSTLLNTARKNTFGHWWKFDGKKGWKPTSERLAQAGFYNNPLKDAPDTCACAYCDVQLDGWSKNDDPEKEHRSRRPDCFFFNAPSSSRGAGPSGTAPKENLKASRSTTRKKANHATHQQQPQEEEDEDDSVIVVAEAAPANGNKTNKLSASTSRKGKSTKSRSATSASIISEAEESALEEPMITEKKQEEDDTIASKSTTIKGKKGKTTAKKAALKTSTRNKQHVEDTIIELESEAGEDDTQHQHEKEEEEAMLGKEKIAPAKTRTRSTRSNIETSIVPPPVVGTKKATTTRKSTAVRSSSKSKKKPSQQHEKAEQEEDTQHDNEQDEAMTEIMTENENENETGMSEAEPSQSQSQDQSQSQKSTKNTKSKGKSLSRSISSTENKSARSKNKTTTRGKKNDDDELEEPELSEMEHRNETETEHASLPVRLSKSASSSGTMKKSATVATAGTKGKGKKSVQQDQVEVSEQSEADVDQRNETEAEKDMDKDTTLSRSASTTSSTRRTRNMKGQLEDSIAQTDAEEDTHEEDGEQVKKVNKVMPAAKAKTSMKTASTAKAMKKSTSSRKKQSTVEEESALEEEEEENATTTMDASIQPTQRMDESAISFSTSTRDTSTPQPSTAQHSKADAAGKPPFTHTAVEDPFTSESEISHISQTDDNASVPSSSSPPLEQHPRLLPSSENNLPDVPTPKAQSGGRNDHDVSETARKPMIQEGGRDEEVTELVVKNKDAVIINPPSATTAIDLEDTASTAASSHRQNEVSSSSRAIPSESSSARIVKPIPKRLSSSNADSSASKKDIVAPPARSSRSKTTTKQAKSTSGKRSKEPSATLVPSGQSALDALLAGPVPTFDSPEKQAARPQPRLESIANKQPLGATSPSSVQNNLARNLSPEEENMPVKDWFERIRQEQISRFIAQSDALLNEFDTQAQHKRAQLVDLARTRTLQHS